MLCEIVEFVVPKTLMSWNGLAFGHYVGNIAKLVLTNVGQFFDSNYLNIPN
jgi:hypothetical protein